MQAWTDLPTSPGIYAYGYTIARGKTERLQKKFLKHREESISNFYSRMHFGLEGRMWGGFFRDAEETKRAKFDLRPAGAKLHGLAPGAVLIFYEVECVAVTLPNFLHYISMWTNRGAEIHFIQEKLMYRTTDPTGHLHSLRVLGTLASRK